MKNMKKQMPVSVFLAAVMLTCATTSTHATVLTINKSPTQFAFPDPFFGPVSPTAYPDYGDNVTLADLTLGQDRSAARGQLPGTTVFHYGAQGGPTPDITVDYLGPVSDSVVANSGIKAYQDANYPLGFLSHLVDSVPRRLFTFTSTHATDILSLRSFTLYTGGFVHGIDDLRVVRINPDTSETVLYSTGPTNAGPAPAIFNFNAAPLEGKILAIDFDAQQNNFVWDDITFVQEIPEPSAMVLLGVAALLAIRRRRS